jgi:pimeloyl-ACP methyl ester carboxylesterase
VTRGTGRLLPLLTAAGGTALVLALTALGQRSRRAVAADREQAMLSRAVEGRAATVTSSDGTTLHAEIFGVDEVPTVVLVHGLTCTLQFWRYQLQELAGHRVVAFDLRGHGASAPASDADYSTSALAADLDAVLEACVPAGERVVVAGHSMGAMSIVAWAGAHPDKVRERLAGAVLVNTGVDRLIDEARILITAAALSTLKRWIGRRVLGLSLHGPRRPTAVFQRIVRYVALGSRATPALVAFC